MNVELGPLFAVLFSLSIAFAGDDQDQRIRLTVPSGAPLRLFLTKKVSKRVDAPVAAKVLEPVFAFDREVVPAGTDARGRVSRLEPLPKWQRVRTILAGDFTPLHSAQVEFTTLVLPDGREVPLHTMETAGLNSIYTPPPPKKKLGKGHSSNSQPGNGGVLGIGKQAARDRINAQINARTRGVADIVRGPNKKEKLIDFVMAKLPYHPQWVRRGTRFDAELRKPLEFGSENVAKDMFEQLGSQPPNDSVVHARLTTPLDSASATRGEVVTAVVTQPLFSSTNKLILPEGTRLNGSVVVAKRARWFHRGGQLRFHFQGVDLPEEAVRLRSAGPELTPVKTEANLDAAESGGKAAIKVDSEGGVQATESKTRLLAPLVSLVIANKSADNDAGRHAANGAAEANVSGRTLGGGLGLGMLGAAVSQSSPYVGMAFGYYGLAWSVYSNVFARGSEVQFEKNAAFDIRFGSRTPPAGAKFQANDIRAGSN